MVSIFVSFYHHIRLKQHDIKLHNSASISTLYSGCFPRRHPASHVKGSRSKIALLEPTYLSRFSHWLGLGGQTFAHVQGKEIYFVQNVRTVPGPPFNSLFNGYRGCLPALRWQGCEFTPPSPQKLHDLNRDNFPCRTS